MAEQFDFDSITAGPRDPGFENIAGSQFDFDSIVASPEQRALTNPESMTSKLVSGGLNLLGLGEKLSDDVGDVMSTAVDDLLSGRALLRGLDITFSPISGTAAAIKAKILGQDAQDAFTNRIVQSLGVAEFVNEELGGNTNIAKTPEDLQFELVASGKGESMTDLQIAGLVFTDIAEALAPIPGIKAGRLGKVPTARATTFAAEKLKAGSQKFLEVIKPLKEKGAKTMSKFLQASGPKKNVSFFERSARSVDSRLKTLGEPGIELGERARLIRDKGELMAGNFITDMSKTVDGLNASETSEFVSWLDGTLTREPTGKLKEAVLSERKRLNAAYDLAEEAFEGSLTNLPVKREGYFPHIFNQDDLVKAEFKKKAVDQMMDSGNFNTRFEAQRAYERFGADLKGRKYGNLETSRLENVDGWIKDPKEALSIYYTRAARRINEAKYFGVDDEIAKALVDKIDNIGGDALNVVTNVNVGVVLVVFTVVPDSKALPSILP